LFSIGRVEASPDDHVVVDDRPGVPSYRRLLISDGRAVGATVLGHHPTDVTAAQKAVRNRARVSPSAWRALRSGDWNVLGELAAAGR
jgi:nitrite reductase (NADH) large subunit